MYCTVVNFYHILKTFRTERIGSEHNKNNGESVSVQRGILLPGNDATLGQFFLFPLVKKSKGAAVRRSNALRFSCPFG